MRQASKNRIIFALTSDGATEAEAQGTIDTWLASGGLLRREDRPDFFYIPNDATDVLATLGFEPDE